MSLLGKKFNGAVGTSIVDGNGDEQSPCEDAVADKIESSAANAPLLHLRYVSRSLNRRVPRKSCDETGIGYGRGSKR